MNFYPEREAERHGIAPDGFREPAVYALSLDTPDTLGALRDRWQTHYAVSPPERLIQAVEDGQALHYVGAAKRLIDRLHDHAAGDVRRAGICAVCPPTGVASIWRDSDPFTAETRYAYAYAADHPGVVVACNGEFIG